MAECSASPEWPKLYQTKSRQIGISCYHETVNLTYQQSNGIQLTSRAHRFASISVKNPPSLNPGFCPGQARTADEALDVQRLVLFVTDFDEGVAGNRKLSICALKVKLSIHHTEV